MDQSAVWAAVEAERLSLADLLTGLAPSEWSVHSLCDGWTVKNVVAHLTMSTVGIREAVTAMIRARGDFNVMIHDTAIAKAAAHSSDDLVAELRSIAGSHRHPPGTKPIDPLVDVIVHGQDISRPLGVDRPIPVEAGAAAATRVWQQAQPHKARERFAGIRFEATDAAIELGEGSPVTGSIGAILLTLTGRSAGLDELSGHGEALVRRAFAR